MTEISHRRAWRLVAVSLLALAVTPVAAQPSRIDLGAATQNFLRMFQPSVSGGFLAGQQAMKDLRTDEAARYFNQIAQAEWDNPLLVERAFVALAADGQIEPAAEAARRLLESQPGSELAELVVATVDLKQGRFDVVEQRLSEVGQDSFSGITAGILRGWALVGEGQGKEAQALLQRLGADGLEDFLVFHRALMAQVSGDTKSAIRLTDQAFEIEPYVPRIAEAYAGILANAGQKDAAVDVLDEFEAQGIKHPVITALREKLEVGEIPAAFPADVQMGAAEMFHGIGVALSRDGSADLALVFLQLARYLDPEGDVIPMSLGQLLDLANQHEAANAQYEAISATSPMKATAVVKLAQNLEASGDRDEAIRRLRNIVAINPEDMQAVTVLGDLFSADENWTEAAKAYSDALELAGEEAPGQWGLHYVRGIAYERAGEWPKAEADFKKALELNPDEPSVLNYLGYSWIDMDMNLDEALAMIEKAVEARPEDGYIIDSLGWAFYKLDRMDEAVETLERAVSLLPNDPELNDHLGDAYLAVGREREASFQWNIATAVDPIGKVADRAAPKIARADKEREEQNAIRLAAYEARENARETQPASDADPQSPDAVAQAPQTGDAADADETPVPPQQPDTAQAPTPTPQPDVAEDTTPAPQPEETPEPAPVEEAPPEAVLAEEVYVVVSGDNLWDIARERYGEGAQFQKLVEANRDLISDPDMIQPGLRLVLPQR